MSTNVVQFGVLFTTAGLGMGIAVAVVNVAFTDAFGVQVLHRCIGVFSLLMGVLMIPVPLIAGSLSVVFYNGNMAV